MNSHIKERPVALLAVLVCVVLAFSIWVCARGSNEAPLPAEDSSADAGMQNSVLKTEPSTPVEPSASSKDEPEEPSRGMLEVSTAPEESAVSESEEPSVPEESAASEPEESSNPAGPSQPEEPSAPPETPAPEQKPEEKPEPVEYTIKLRVTNTDGKILSGASVTIGEETGKTGSDGYFTTTVTESEVELIVAYSGYVSYYEDMVLTPGTLDTTVMLAKADSLRKLINSAELNPYRTDIPEFNAALDDLFDDILKPGMDTYEKVKTCYDWVIAHMYYKRPTHKAQGYWQCAYQALQDGYGTCNCYSLLFTAMMRHIGLNCYYVEGSTSASGGGMTGHYWTIIEIGGETYVFDPQVEDAIADRTKTKEVTYVRFCLSEPHSKYVYSVRSREKCMLNFESYLKSHGTFLG